MVSCLKIWEGERGVNFGVVGKEGRLGGRMWGAYGS